MDATATAQLSASSLAVAWFIWLDISGDPLRITTLGADFTFASTGDSDLDGNTFNAFRADVLTVGPVSQSDSGSDTVTVTLSGIVMIDTTLLNAIGDRTLWQGRTCRIWFAIYDPTGTTQQGAIVPHYTGYMTSVEIADSPQTQQITLSAENYLAAFNEPSNRSYLNQSTYDPADTSAGATIAAANGARHHGNGGRGNSTGTAGGTGGANRGHVNLA
jgi:hypothetical protein